MTPLGPEYLFRHLNHNLDQDSQCSVYLCIITIETILLEELFGHAGIYMYKSLLSVCGDTKIIQVKETKQKDGNPVSKKRSGE